MGVSSGYRYISISGFTPLVEILGKARPASVIPCNLQSRHVWCVPRVRRGEEGLRAQLGLGGRANRHADRRDVKDQVESRLASVLVPDSLVRRRTSSTDLLRHGGSHNHLDDHQEARDRSRREGTEGTREGEATRAEQVANDGETKGGQGRHGTDEGDR